MNTYLHDKSLVYVNTTIKDTPYRHGSVLLEMYRYHYHEGTGDAMLFVLCSLTLKKAFTWNL